MSGGWQMTGHKCATVNACLVRRWSASCSANPIPTIESNRGYLIPRRCGRRRRRFRRRLYPATVACRRVVVNGSATKLHRNQPLAGVFVTTAVNGPRRDHSDRSLVCVCDRRERSRCSVRRSTVPIVDWVNISKVNL